MQSEQAYLWCQRGARAESAFRGKLFSPRKLKALSADLPAKSDGNSSSNAAIIARAAQWGVELATTR
jgi:hypothetical protein